MPINKYCWRCKTIIPMLTDEEWKIVASTITSKRLEEIQLKENLNYLEAKERLCDTYNEITGYNEMNVNAIWHHIASLYGTDCVKCAKPYRTPNAKFCAACGYEIPKQLD